MNAIAKLRERLQRYPNARVEATETSLTVYPPNAEGFPVTLQESPGEYMVTLEGWHEDFTDEGEAIDCVGMALSSRSRLAITYRGNSPVKWALEFFDEGSWRSTSVTGLIFTPFWRTKRLVYHSNTLLDSKPDIPDSPA